MAFIPIDAKADLQGQKKGKITPAQHAILNSWSLASKTGILDFPQDHTKRGRCETDTLNITNIQNYETEIVFNKGYLVVCGRLVECEDGTKFIFKTPITGTETGRIVARFSLGSSGNEEFKILQKTGALVQNDLNDNQVNGEYEFELYSYEATPTTVKLTRTQPYIPDIGGKLAQFEASLKDEGKPLHGYDDSKGTIEERLTNLGFKEATITDLNSIYVDSIIAYQQGKVVAIAIKIKGNYASNLSGVVAKITGIDLSWLPEEMLLGIVTSSSGAGGGGIVYYSANHYSLKKDGSIYVTSAQTQGKSTSGFSRTLGHIFGKEDKYTMTFL